MPTRPFALVADADPNVNDYLVVVTERAGLDVVHLAGPWELDAAADGTAALVILGGQGNGVRAADAALALRLAGDRTPVLILANGANPEAASLADTDRSIRVLQKPVTPGELLGAVNELLGRGDAPAAG